MNNKAPITLRNSIHMPTLNTPMEHSDIKSKKYQNRQILNFNQITIFLQSQALKIVFRLLSLALIRNKLVNILKNSIRYP